MQVIWKYDIDVTDYFTRTMPDDARFLSVQTQRGRAQMWALVDPEAPKKEYHFAVIGTGLTLNDDILRWRFLGTFQLSAGDLVFHLFWKPQES